MSVDMVYALRNRKNSRQLTLDLWPAYRASCTKEFSYVKATSLPLNRGYSTSDFASVSSQTSMQTQTISTPTRTERIEAALWGLLIGNACGVPYEFHAASAIPSFHDLDMIPPAGFARSHAQIAPDTWSDDGAHALCLLASLLENNGLNVDDFSQKLVAWYDHGDFAVDRIVFDVGVQTRRSILALKAGVVPLQAGLASEQSNGNGSLMRVLPLALWHQGSDGELIRDAQLQSRITHAHMRSQIGCALYCIWARRVLEQAEDPWANAIETLRSHYAEGSPEREEFEWSIRPEAETLFQGSGYVVDCLRSSRWAVAQGSYETAIKSAISLGNDTDTTACVAGGIAALRDGLEAIPQRWREQLRGQEIAKPLIARLVERVYE